MASIFNLKTSANQLTSANAGLSNVAYDEVAPTREIAGTSFPSGSINYKWSVSGQKHWMPSRSYLRARVKLSKANGEKLDASDNIAPNMNMLANLFQSMEFRINGTTVSRVSDFVGQCEALALRTRKSKAWLDSAGESTILTGANFADRQGVVASGANSGVREITKAQMSLPATTTLAYTSADGTIAEVNCTAAQIKEAYPVGSVLNLNGKRILIIGHLAGGIQGSIGLVDEGANATFHKEVTQAGKSDRSVSEFEICWKPESLSIFNVQHAMPTGEYELILNPQSTSAYKAAGIESTGVTKTAGADYDLEVQSMMFEAATVEGDRVDSKTYLLDLEEINCMADSIDNVSFGAKTFEAKPSTYALTVAYQDGRVGTNTQYSASKFKSANAAGTLLNEEQKLNRFTLNFAGRTMPRVDADPQFDASVDRTTQRYIDSVIAGGSYFSAGGCETLKDWQDRGQYYHFQTPRDGSDTSTRVSVSQQFVAGTDVTNLRVLLFSHSRSTARITIESGRVISVDTAEV